MGTKPAVFLVLTLIASYMSMYSTALALTIAFPPNESFVEHESVNVVLQFKKDALDSVVVKVNNFLYPPMDIAPGSENICFGIILASGMNNISVEGYKNKKKTVTRDLTFFFRSALDPESRKAPRDFKQYVFHTRGQEAGCTSCHKMDPELSDLNPARPQDSSCYSCHRNKMVSGNLHVPAKEWNCLQCHETKKGEKKYNVPKPIDKICYRCHGEKVSSWKNMKMMHGPTAVGQCTLCHDPHGSDWPSFVRMHTTDLCNNCHTDKTSGKHVIAGFFGKGHPTRGVPDPHTPGREFTCAGCHSPHASDYGNMLKNDNRVMGQYCNGCHKK